MFVGNKNENIRAGDLVLHCVDVKIFQKITHGIELSGHGIIKTNNVGTLYLEFICTKQNNAPQVFFSERFPNDALDKTQTLYLEATTIDGELFEASSFFMDIDHSLRNLPTVCYIFLPSLSCTEEPMQGMYDQNCDYLHFEFLERFDLPFNKSNTTESSLGSKTFSWNQADIQMDEYLVTIIHHKDYTTVDVKGVFDINAVRDCLKFYIGFSSGSLPQLGYMTERKKGAHTHTQTLSSVSARRKQQQSSSPMISNLAIKGSMSHDYHYDLFRSITKIYAEKHKRFESIVAQWERVWFATQSNDEILTLTLSVAIEGVLNDVYIPYIKATKDTTEEDAEASFIKKELKKTDLTDQQRSRILGSVAYWKNVTSASAFTYLIDKGLLDKHDKKAWTDLRNNCAHPRLVEKTVEDEKAEIELTVSCLNIFYRLILNTFEYSGYVGHLKYKQQPKVYSFEHRAILD
ncbi:hypothetical protein [Aliivibrio fischeri]|uniref:hypothetical protein n=1 Tax=Aliivibrio fischeri TaxID=668 RepID=UPI00084C056D|nr:hypothetical protein [Aliivibrio fischeri]OED51089.1 hypothetical protein BEI47_10630 [Aliivibrio fischeri]